MIFNGKQMAAFVNFPEDTYNAGMDAERRRFWAALQQNGNRRNYMRAFYQPTAAVTKGVEVWTDETFQPIYPIVCAGGNAGDDMISSTAITEIKVPIIIHITAADPMNNPNLSDRTFYNNPKLHTISSLFVEWGQSFVNWFTRCTALKNIRFAAGSCISRNISFRDCPLSSASVQSIINALDVDYPSTLTLSASTGAELTDALRTGITETGWTLVY